MKVHLELHPLIAVGRDFGWVIVVDVVRPSLMPWQASLCPCRQGPDEPLCERWHTAELDTQVVVDWRLKADRSLGSRPCTLLGLHFVSFRGGFSRRACHTNVAVIVNV